MRATPRLHLVIKNVTLNGKEIKGGYLRGPGGRFATYKEPREVAMARATQLQERVAEQIKADIGHTRFPRPSTGRLIAATLDRQNMFVSDDGLTWGVGNAAWLDESAAKYWRMIEQGSAGTKFVGREIWVFRGGGPGGSDKIRARKAEWIPSTAKNRWREFPGMGNHGYVVVENDIIAHESYLKAYASMLEEVAHDEQAAMARAVMRYFTEF